MNLTKKLAYSAILLLILLFLGDAISDLFHKPVVPNLQHAGTVIVNQHGVIVVNSSGTSTTVYVPPEGGTTVIPNPPDPAHPGATPTVTVKIKDRGFCRRLGVAAVYSGKFLPQLDMKLAYYKRYSVAVGVNLEYINLGVYRHVDDLVGLINLEFGVNGGVGFDGARRYGVGLRLNL